MIRQSKWFVVSLGAVVVASLAARTIGQEKEPAPAVPAPVVVHSTNRAPVMASTNTPASSRLGGTPRPAAVVPVVTPSRHEPTEIPMPATTRDSFIESQAKGKFEIGTRITHIILLEDTRGEPFHDSFVGSVTMLKEDQDYLPIKLYVQYRFLPALAAGVSYDRFGAKAVDYGGSDGTSWMSGPLVYLSGRYINDSRFTPYGELGVAFYSGKFENAPGWGSEGNKHFYLNDSQGFYVAAGCGMSLDDNWSADFYGRYMNLDVDGEYMMNGHHQEDILFTMSHVALGLGVKYSF